MPQPYLIPLDWIGTSKENLRSFPTRARHDIGVALMIAQLGGKSPKAKPFKGQGPGVLEVVEDHRGDTFRAVYTVKFTDRIYVLHCFQKKSRHGRKTDRKDIELVRQRLRLALEDHARLQGQE